jgi:glycosyltransferase involved in cell wall biosynthesis
LKIVVLGTRGFPNIQGGVEKHCQELTRSLAKNGCDVTVLTRAPYIDRSITNYNNVKLIHLPAIKNKFLEAYCHTFLGVIVARRLNPDVLHIQAIGPGFFSLFARILGLKVVLTSHGSNYKHQKWGRFSRLFLRVCEYMGIKFANQVIAISQTIADEIQLQYNRKVTVIPNGVVLPKLINEIACLPAGRLLPPLNQRGDRNDAISRFGVKTGKYILAVGRFVEGKGFEDLIPAFAGMTNGFGEITKDWKLVIAGDADHEDEYSRELKKKAQAVPGVVLTGFLSGEPLQELYSNARLFVLPSYYEGLPIVLLEAMSYGLSCIASDIPANREVGLPEERLFKAGDIQALSIKIIEYIKKPMDAEEKAQQIKLISEKYNWDKIAEKTLDVYKKTKNSCN